MSADAIYNVILGAQLKAYKEQHDHCRVQAT